MLSIGLPVYNGQRFLEHTLDSLLGQSFGNFELIISDNASTDLTPDICRDFASRDSRIHYVRHAENRGAVFNWNHVVHEAKGTYFKWASANDYYDSRFLDACIGVLRNHSDAVLCFTRTQRVTDEDEPLEIDDHDMAVLDPAPSTRYIRMMNHLGRNNAQAGVIRLEALRKTRLERTYPHGDHVLMAELALHGKFYLVEDALFYRRWGQQSASTSALNQAELRKFLVEAPAQSHQMDLWTKQIDFARVALRSSLPAGEKLAVMNALARQCIRRRRALWNEIRIALSP